MEVVRWIDHRWKTFVYFTKIVLGYHSGPEMSYVAVRAEQIIDQFISVAFPNALIAVFFWILWVRGFFKVISNEVNGFIFSSQSVSPKKLFWWKHLEVQKDN